MAYIPANFVQGMAAGWIFRQLKLHPALKYGRDWLWFTLVGILAANAFGALWGTSVLRMFGLITAEAQPVAWAGWFLGNSVASWVLGVLLLKFLSPLVIKTKAFCKGTGLVSCVLASTGWVYPALFFPVEIGNT
jgi:hypothetical protein